jgi:hypothetical protein
MALITKIVTLKVTFDEDESGNPKTWDWNKAMCERFDDDDVVECESIEVLKVEDPTTEG